MSQSAAVRRGAPEARRVLDRYLHDIARVPLLTAEAEVALATRIEAAELALRDAIRRSSLATCAFLRLERKDGEPARLDRSAVQRIVEQLREAGPSESASVAAIERATRDADRAVSEFATANLRLVVAIGRRHMHLGLDFLDLLQEGNTGLLRAIEKFDHRRGYRFSTYASWWVRQAMSRALADKGSTIRVPVHLVEERRRVTKTMQRLVQATGREPTEEETAVAARMGAAKVRTVLASHRPTMSLDAPLGADARARIAELVADTRRESPEESSDRSLLGALLRGLLHRLSPREQRILRLRYGLDGLEEHTLDEIAKEVGLTPARVQQIEVKALRKLERPARKRKLHEYVTSE